MGLAIESVKTTLSILKKHPKILILTLVFTFIGQLQGSVSFIYQILLLPAVIFLSLLYGAAIQLIVKDALSSETLSLRKSLFLGLKKLHKVLGLMLLSILIFLGIFLPAIFAILFFSAISSISWVLIIVAIILILITAIAVVYVPVKLIFATPILMIEDSGIAESLKKSWRVSRNKFWSIVGAFTIVGLLFIPYLIAMMILIFVSTTQTGGYIPTSFLLIYFLVSIALSLVPSTLLSLLPATYYLKIKGEK